MLPAMMTSPEVARSSPAIMRSVVVLPQPEGPRRQTTSPGATDRSASLTAVKSPKLLVTFLISIVDMSALHGSECHAAQQVILQEERDEEDRDEEQGFDGREQRPVGAAAAG
jgi:hypothetical protein